VLTDVGMFEIKNNLSMEVDQIVDRVPFYSKFRRLTLIPRMRGGDEAPKCPVYSLHHQIQEENLPTYLHTQSIEKLKDVCGVQERMMNA
jgi:hypothetical protein